ncbi:hypothetical protein [Agromyces albus]|uniref:DUF2975 domain-containing protein n=1 Tax=Agromyces albus TaxID=205332 RepID=A0A4Q2KU14_9MICO|nr:hypothetical protein [Agromyces albus]RXZ68267.1 hypothetical protein ESP51_14430 [Agromyces albus]
MTGIRPTTHPRRDRLDGWGLRAITGGALLIGIAGLVGLVLRAVHLLTAESLSVDGLQLANAASPLFADETPAIVDAHYDSVTLVIDGLPAGLRWLMVSQTTVAALLGIGLCLIVFILGMHLLERRPFARSATWSIFAAAVLVMATGTLAPFLHAISDAEVVQFLGDTVTAGPNTGGAEVLVFFGLTIDPAPFGWGLALSVVAAAFQLGERLQRDTDGLV